MYHLFLVYSVNPLRAHFVRGNVNIYLHLIHSYTQIAPMWFKTRTYLFYIVNIMGVDAHATQGANAPTNMVFTKLNQINSVPAR